MSLFVRYKHSDRAIPVLFRSYPNGEQIIPSFDGEVGHVILRWESDKDLISLLLLKSVLNFKDLYLTIQYMPYSRMDRGENGSRCSLRYIGEFVKALGFKWIQVIDPHSDLTLAYLGENTSAIYPFQETFREPFEQTDIVLFPDAGAAKRYSDVWKGVQLVANKKRDFATGKILGYNIENSSLVAGKHITIVDDLCSKGTTFLYAGKALKEAGAKVVDLVVTHCEDSIHSGELLKPGSPINLIYTTNSLLNDKDHFRLVVYDVLGTGKPV